MTQCKKVLSTLLALLLVWAVPTTAAAASLEVTASLKASLDKTLAAADRAQAEKISALYNELLSLQQQEQEWDSKLKALHESNKNTSSALAKQVKQIDEASLNRLEAEFNQAKERYKPLFAQYTSLNKQIDAARAAKNKDLSAMLQLHANVLKIPIKLARMDLEAKMNAWQAAKKATGQKVKRIRGILDDADPIREQIKAKNSAVRTLESSITPAWNGFKQAARKGDSSGVQSSLATAVSLSRQIHSEKQKTYQLEAKISEILSKAGSQIP
ncbi:hypothetical protein O9H85_16425 [Paenibacillus filicis]|uniref:Conjugal transfer protein n=1 Tax=Paenibacillus gyeongsangnamensis TaxID=3388067 RepID=A0ABT4QAR4_9BACL|nr:hypothetical protein [Paenibacillus filicis]MCZ8513978.1 hypothetical protein [Paenibacillus filicis]